jgi:septum formation protein
MYSFIYLASKSPRRQELLTQMGVPFKLLEQQAEELLQENESAEEFVTRLAKDKAISSHKLLQQKKSLESILKTVENAPVLGADTIVVVTNKKDHNQEIILGKPKDKNDALQMLRLLSNNTHKVYTSVCMTDGLQTLTTLSYSQVSFCRLSEQDIEDYCNSGEPEGKAGSYAIQGKAATFISHISGSYSSIMGLPIYETNELIKRFNISF